MKANIGQSVRGVRARGGRGGKGGTRGEVRWEKQEEGESET